MGRNGVLQVDLATGSSAQPDPAQKIPVRPYYAIWPGSGLNFEPDGQAGLGLTQNTISAVVGPGRSSLVGFFRTRAQFMRPDSQAFGPGFSVSGFF